MGAGCSVGVACGIAGALFCNCHYQCCGGSIIEGLLASPLIRLANTLWRSSVRKKMIQEGIPEPSVTLEYAPGLFMDVFDFRGSKKVAAPVVLYFHAGAFFMGGREFSTGVMSWLAEQGIVGISVGYLKTSDPAAAGLGLAGCIASAWDALRYVKAHASEFGIDVSKIVVMGDSAGASLALSLATGLLGGNEGKPAPAEERPAAAISGWGVCTLGSKTFCAIRAPDGSWDQTPARADLGGKSIWIPEGYGKTPQEAQRQLQKVFGGVFLLFGRRARGWLPASVASHWPSDDGMSVSPLSLADKPGLPPILMLVAEKDAIVPANQQLMFAELARAGGNSVGALVFEGGDHGVGGINSSAGRAAVERFLAAQDVQLKTREGANGDPHEHMRRSARALGVDKDPSWAHYDVAALDGVGTGWLYGMATAHLPRSDKPTQ